ncbi:hypothetical protein MVEN_00510700 [Mycena venus]|uniref:Uncharacterized protein n=1 Tax=Mycena venus TaxID=2733690 RepID=A0A8H6YN24_9AGAR|nr:hypothetical protein MVEN_00510700 [Mycena venus]
MLLLLPGIAPHLFTLAPRRRRVLRRQMEPAPDEFGLGAAAPQSPTSPTNSAAYFGSPLSIQKLKDEITLLQDRLEHAGVDIANLRASNTDLQTQNINFRNMNSDLRVEVARLKSTVITAEAAMAQAIEACKSPLRVVVDTMVMVSVPHVLYLSRVDLRIVQVGPEMFPKASKTLLRVGVVNNPPSSSAPALALEVPQACTSSDGPSTFGRRGSSVQSRRRALPPARRWVATYF